MNKKKLNNMIAGLEPWKEDFGQGMEQRGPDGVSWYDLSVNCNSVPCETDTAIIVTAWAGQLKWLKATLSSYRKTGAFVILAYDNPLYAWMPRDRSVLDRCMPNANHYILANSVVHKHITYDADKRNGWFWDVRYAQGLIKQFPNIKYIYCTNGDCIIDKPETFRSAIDLLGDADVMAGQSREGMLHTATMLFKARAFHSTFDRFAEIMRVPIMGGRGPESTLIEVVNALGLKIKHAPAQPLDKDGTMDAYARYNQDSTWKTLMGFRNLFAEYETAGNEGTELLQFSAYVDDYMDWIYWGGQERETICQYWKTKDRRYLYQFWDMWEDSWYNRLFYPLDHYGKEPILL